MESIEREVPLFPLGEVVLFPGMLLPLHIFEDRYRAMIGACQVTDQLFGVLLIRSGSEVGPPATPEEVGCTARIAAVQRLPDGRMNVATRGESRFRLLEAPRQAEDGYLVGRARIVTAEEPPATDGALVRQVADSFRAYTDVLARASRRPRLAEQDPPIGDPLGLSFQVAAALRIEPRERQALLEEDSFERRLQRELVLLRRERRALQVLLADRTADRSIGGRFSVN